MKRVGFVGFMTALLVVGTLGAQDPVFDLGLSGGLGCGGTIEKENGGGAVLGAPVEVDVVLSTAENPSETHGAQGWSISVASENVVIDAITTDGTVSAVDTAGGLRNTGFEKSETTMAAGDGSECVGLNGAVSAVVLSFVADITLPPVGDAVIAKLTVSGGDFPVPEPLLVEEDPSVTVGSARVFFANGCQGLGQPVDNNVTYQGSTVVPTGNECAIELVATAPPPPPADCPAAGHSIQVIAQTESTMEVAELNAGMVETPDTLLPGILTASPGEVTVYYGIVSNDLDDPATADAVEAVQGWSLAIGVEDSITLVSATTDGTVGAAVPDGLRDTGFEKTEVIDPNNPEAPVVPQGQGAVSAVVLSFTLPITLLPSGTATVLALTVETEAAEADVTKTGSIFAKDGLQGAGQPVNSVATVAGSTVEFSCIQDATISLTAVSIGSMVRADANADQKVNIADPIYIINALFREGPPVACREAADANDDNLVDLSDATFILAYQFYGGPPPPPPFEECGMDEDSTPESCPSKSNCP